jgi:opacity protein-like surface antigen
MKRSLFGVTVGLALAAATANAQSMTPVAKPVSFGVSGGLSVPTGDLSDGVNSGFNLSGLVEFQPPALPVSFRLDVQYQQFGAKEGDAKAKTIGGLANVLYHFPTKSLVRPYVTGGLGLVNYKISGDVCDEFDCPSDTKFAYDLGAGIEFQLTGMSTFIEADWQSIQTEGSATRMIPIRVGIKF